MSKATPAPPPRLLTVAEAADHLDTTTSNLYEFVAKRNIPSVRIGRAIRIPQEGPRPTRRRRLSRPRSAPNRPAHEPPAKRPQRAARPNPARSSSAQQQSDASTLSIRP
jgi:excisionase family DNA binding protein